MKADDTRRAREVTDLARMLPVPAERDLPAGRLPIVKEHLMTELRTDQPAAHRDGRAHRPGRTAWTVAGAGLLAAAAAAAAASVIGLTGQSGGTGGHITAARLLSKIADEAAQARAQDVAGNQFMYIKTEGRRRGPLRRTRPLKSPPASSLDSGSRPVQAWPGNRKWQEV